jgi:tripeptide aminopeptidase
VLSPGAPVEQLFCELVAIPSPSGHERAVGEAIRQWLAAAGVESSFDGAGAENDSDAGNLIARVPGSPGAPALLFVAHMDTVESGAEPVRPEIDPGGVIRSSGNTILGADNKSAVATVMRTLAWAASQGNRAHRPTVIGAFTCREEAGRMGVSLLGPALVAEVDCAFSVDGSSPIGTVITRALGQQVFTILIRGRAAHAAADPDAGVSAISVASEAVAAMKLGRLPDGGSASIAAIIGGAVLDRLDGITGGREGVRATLEATPTNSVPDLAMLRGEVRGYDEREIDEARAGLERAVSDACRAQGATYEWQNRERAVPPFPGAADSRALALARAACDQVPEARFAVAEAHATLEANYLCAATDVVALSSGGRDAHQFTESITIGELRTLESLLRAIVVETAAD